MLKAISESKKLANLTTDGARLLFTWLIPQVDVNGCFSGDPEVVQGKVFTRLGKTTQTVEKYLSELASAKLIVRYSANGDDFLCIPDFAYRQPNLRADRESPSRIPLPSNENAEYKKKTIPVALVKEVVARDGIICQICGKEGMYEEHFNHFVIEKDKDKFGRDISFEIDHITPEYLGGPTILENLRLTCRKCNRSRVLPSTPAELRRNSRTSKVKESKVKESKTGRGTPDEKQKYLECILLTEQQYARLVKKFTKAGADDRIQNLNDGIMSKGYKYDSHYHTILAWDRRDKKKNTEYKPPPLNVGPDGKTPGQRLREKIEADSEELEGDK